MYKNVFMILVLGFFILTVFADSAICDESNAYYIDATNGNDSDIGTSPDSAWKTIFKINNYDFKPGDSILFKRGETWREKLIITNSGDSSNPITYGAYGSGAKPMLLGSTERNAESDWLSEGDNIWSTVIHKDENQLLPNPSFDENTDEWMFSTEGDAEAALYRDTEIYNSAPAGVRINCVDNGQEKVRSNIFLWTEGISLIKEEWYVLSFNAKASTTFDLTSPNILKSSGGDAFSLKSQFDIPVSTEWANYNVFYRTDITDGHGQIRLNLESIPNGAKLFIDTFSFRRCKKIPLAADVGTLIFNEEESVGIKVDYKEELDTQGDFWYDYTTGKVKMYSTNNPANYYSDIECTLGSILYGDEVLEGSITNYADYITLENLDLRYGGSDGIWNQRVEGVKIRNCDISYCGGNYQLLDLKLRKGDGIVFWENSHDCLVEGCKIGEIYDVGATNQGEKTSIQSNISYRNNLIWNCEWSFSFFSRPESSVIKNIRFENNTCIAAGFGWSHEQRPDPKGIHVWMKGSTASADGIHISNNVFYEASGNCFYFSTDPWTEGANMAWSDLTNFEMNNNYYYQSSGSMIIYPDPASGKYEERGFTMSEFSDYQDFSGQDAHSITGDKTLVQDAARSKVSSEDVSFINELFQQADEKALNYITKQDDSNGTPGFELLLLLSALAMFIYWKKKK